MKNQIPDIFNIKEVMKKFLIRIDSIGFEMIAGVKQMKDWYKEVGERILCVRLEKGYTREQLAELVSISPKFLYEIETGRKGFSAYVLHNLCASLSVNADYILTGTEKMDGETKLLRTLQQFDGDQMEQMSIILQQVYDLFH